jgi:hypothetical protein
MLIALEESRSALIEVDAGLTLPSGAVLRPSEGRLELNSRASPIRLNDVEMKGTAGLRPGDQFSEGPTTYLVLPYDPEPSRTIRKLRHDAFLARIDEEISGTRDFAMVLARSAAFRWLPAEALFREIRLSGRRPVFGQPTPDLIEVLVLHEPGDAIETLKISLGKAAEGREETIQWATAVSPLDGGTPEELWAVAVDRLLGLETLESQGIGFADPAMVRLWTVAETVTGMRCPVALVGDRGVGRETFARRVRTLATPSAPFVVHGAGRFERRRWDDDVARASGGALHIRHPEILPGPERAAFFSARQFLPSANFEPGADRPRLRSEVFVPSLRDRPADVSAIAEHVLHLVDTRLARRRSTIRSEARQGLNLLLGGENVRSLRNGIIRSALNVTGTELRPEHLEEPGEPGGAGIENLRQQLRDTERRALEEALRQARWNVSEASRLMQLPRRTVVYRMRRLGVRRPASKP